VLGVFGLGLGVLVTAFRQKSVVLQQ